jgi:hypothetical protein
MPSLNQNSARVVQRVKVADVIHGFAKHVHVFFEGLVRINGRGGTVSL